MGLDTSHDCFHGTYSAFNRLRKAVARACGGGHPPYAADYDADFLRRNPSPDPNMWYFEGEIVPSEHHNGMRLFLGHSDCDGEFNPTEASSVAAFLRWAAPKVEAEGGGHLKQTGMRGAVERFAAGCEAAAAAGETVTFG